MESSSVVLVEDVSDSECEDEYNDYIHNRRPQAGEWIEPIEIATPTPTPTPTPTLIPTPTPTPTANEVPVPDNEVRDELDTTKPRRSSRIKELKRNQLFKRYPKRTRSGRRY